MTDLANTFNPPLKQERTTGLRAWFNRQHKAVKVILVIVVVWAGLAIIGGVGSAIAGSHAENTGALPASITTNPYQAGYNFAAANVNSSAACQQLWIQAGGTRNGSNAVFQRWMSGCQNFQFGPSNG